jgi:hypothetical protein
MATRHDAAITGLALGSASLMALQSSAAAIYKNQAPPGTLHPYLIYAESGGGPDNRFAGSHDDVTYTLKCVADNDANGLEVAETAAELIDTVFRRPTSVTLTGSWVERATTVIGQFSYGETLEKKTYTHAGRIIRLRADK